VAIPFSKRVSIVKDALINVVDEESVILNLKDERYYGLDGVGTSMWGALTTSASIQAAYERLLNEYEVDGEVLRRDLTSLIEQLLARGLVELSNE
jgi:Coenzyme PQQ synthesis protein D (PqqD)